ncbi:MAG: four helix bundle protein [Flavobacteriales bacterium]|nr:four helix bundle protein [Flavobacteriales bacterium]
MFVKAYSHEGLQEAECLATRHGHRRPFELFDSIPLSQAGFKIRDQATDAACSIPSNIAEGSSRRSEKEKYRYLEIALGSAFELQTRLLIVQRRKWISPGGMDKLLIAVEQEQKKVAF